MRISGLAAATILPPDQLQKTVTPLAKDADPIVSKLASAILARAKAATTQPSSQPTTMTAPGVGGVVPPAAASTPSPNKAP
jgi:hypothetical protein